MVIILIVLLTLPIFACSMEQAKDAIQLEPLSDKTCQQIPQRIMLTHARSIDHPAVANAGLVKIDNINYLEWHAKDYLLKKRFSELMEEKRKQKLPLLVALLTVKHHQDNAQYIHEGKAFYDSSNVFSKYSDLFGNKYYCKMLDVELYAIWHPCDSQADFLGTTLTQFQRDVHNSFNFLNAFFEWQDQPDKLTPDLKYQIGCHYKKQKKYFPANQWLQEAADQGCAKAYNDLGEVLYFEYKQTDKALPWFIKAAENNDLYGLEHTAWIYYDKKEYTIAQKYLEQGANQWLIAEHTVMNEQESNERLQCRAKIQMLLASLYEKQGNLVNAKKWYEQASKYNSAAKKEYERLKNQKS